MKVIILCGGTGTRLKEETEFKPKPMIEVGGKPLLWHIMKIYAHYGFNDFILALGYKANYVKEFFLNQKAFTSDFTLNTKKHETTYYLGSRKNYDIDDMNITFVDTGLETDTGERVLNCKKYIPEEDDYFMVTYGDGVSDLNINEVYQFHKNQNTIGTITVVHPRTKFGQIKIQDGNPTLVKGFEEKPLLKDLINGGFMIFKKEFFDYLKPGEPIHAAFPQLIHSNQLSAYKYEGFWFAVDTIKELEQLNQIWASEASWKVWR